MDVLVVAKAGNAYASTVDTVEKMEAAGEEFFGIIEAGGNIWDTETGDMPEDVFEYDVIATVNVTDWSETSVKMFYDCLKNLSDKAVVRAVMEA